MTHELQFNFWQAFYWQDEQAVLTLTFSFTLEICVWLMT
jgi:hypothetical protein